MKEQTLVPEELFHYFAEVCKVPRPSKHEGRMVEFLKRFAADHGLPCKVDDAGNVLISKPATLGREGLRTVILQSHMDMVCEKNRWRVAQGTRHHAGC